MMETLQFLTLNPNIFLIILAFFSLFIGSFLNVVIYRLPRMMDHHWHEECRLYLGLKPQASEKFNLILPFSHCPQCKKMIYPWHNIPIISYFYLKAHCAFCHAPISIRYPFIEVLTAVISVYVGWKFGVSWQTLVALFFSWICIALTFIDLDFHLLPDQLTLLLLWLGLFASLFNLFCSPSDAIIGALTGYLIFAITQIIFGWLTGKIGMGQGDYKFLAALGAVMGWQMLPLIILLASFSGIIITLTHMAIKGQFKSIPLPFGPYLAIAGFIVLLWGNEIMQYYFELI